ncbi:hypothetical protein V8G54_036517 [Vigna mungo]|uniref:Uncharacterized protein n=1 Tax=Vigna mungo TaxID=3915 RepID=A0AAQ3RFI8_VIGMU
MAVSIIFPFLMVKHIAKVLSCRQIEPQLLSYSKNTATIAIMESKKTTSILQIMTNNNFFTPNTGHDQTIFIYVQTWPTELNNTKELQMYIIQIEYLNYHCE